MVRLGDEAVYRVRAHNGGGIVALRPFSAKGLVTVLAGGLLASGCTPEPGPTPPPVSPSPAVTASPTPTRSETAQEREQRLAFEAAEKAYRAGFAEVGRLLVAGGADRPTIVLRDTMTGQYLNDQMEELRSFKADDLKASSGGALGWVRYQAYSANELRIETCEDFRDVKLIESSGATQAPDNTGTRVYRQVITMAKVGGKWKSSDFETAEQLQDCEP